MTKQFPLPLPHHEAMEADNFMVTASNEEAIAWIDKWPDWSSPTLSLHGPSGSGKTHLLHLWLIQSKGILLSLDELTSQDTGSLITKNKAFALDNADAIAGNDAAEEALFHLYNRLREMKGFLLLTSLNAPAQWPIKLPDLRSRLSSIPAVAIAAPDDALLSGLLIKQFRDRQIDISMDVVDYLLPRITRTPAALRDTVTALDRMSLAEGRGITIALARRFLEDQHFPNS